jgi:hypothetical protein
VLDKSYCEEKPIEWEARMAAVAEDGLANDLNMQSKLVCTREAAIVMSNTGDGSWRIVNRPI